MLCYHQNTKSRIVTFGPTHIDRPSGQPSHWFGRPVGRPPGNPELGYRFRKLGF